MQDKFRIAYENSNSIRSCCYSSFNNNYRMLRGRKIRELQSFDDFPSRSYITDNVLDCSGGREVKDHL